MRVKEGSWLPRSRASPKGTRPAALRLVKTAHRRIPPTAVGGLFMPYLLTEVLQKLSCSLLSSRLDMKTSTDCGRWDFIGYEDTKVASATLQSRGELLSGVNAADSTFAKSFVFHTSFLNLKQKFCPLPLLHAKRCSRSSTN